MKRKFILFLSNLIFGFAAFSQTTFPDNGVKDQRSEYYLFKNATIHVDYKTTVQNGWLLIKSDRIEKIGKDFDYPKSAVVIDLTGKHIYPSFLDIYSDYGMPEIKRTRGGGFGETQFYSSKEGAFAWNQAIKPEVKAADLLKFNSKSAEELRKIGFGSVVSHNKDGIVRGTSVLASLAEGKEQEIVLRNEISTHFSFDKGTSTQTYPVSLMGSVALLRQTYYDALWYKNTNAKLERNLSLEMFSKNLALPSVFNGKSVLDAMRADKIGKEFGVKYIIKSGGDDYQRIDELKSVNAHLIVPINFPKALDVEDPMDAEKISLTDLKHWEMAPSNLAKLASSGISFSISPVDLIDKSLFISNLQKAISSGLDKSVALNALTGSPAKILNIDDLVGSIKNGLLANFLITSDEIFETRNKILENWVQGKKYIITDISLANINGKYDLNLGTQMKLRFEISGENEKPSIEIIENDTTKIKTTVVRDKNFLTINFKKEAKSEGIYRLTGIINGTSIEGEGRDNLGQKIVWKAVINKGNEIKNKQDSTKKSEIPKIGEVIYPFMAFGNSQKLVKEDILIKNATIWTNEKEGKLIADVYVKNGKIESIGPNLTFPSAKVIDGKDKHLTSGIIDEHSHIALFSINEVETVSSEVRQEDAVNSEDIDIYRQIAGGVTAAQLLHGSADCIGGQSALIKLKWGEAPDKLIIENSPKFIKFALGENVKRGNSPSRPNRFPSTRMGVEQVFHDAFGRAINYKKEWAEYNAMKVKTGLTMPRKDLELDALVEILEGKRNITCHSYVQSEINMLMKLADSLGFKVNTLTHILEGYKVADKMKARGVNASTFSDWWAYKMEVKEAIPYNAAIMTKVGVNTAINSDDAEMARRLNQEAAKTILYGGLSEEQAWKTVTLNPAKMLHLDERMGSIKIGKDADLVLWNTNPLSIYAKPEKTIIDGTIYFDIEKEAIKLKELDVEKNRLIQKLLAEKSKGTPTFKPSFRGKALQIHCDSLLEFGGISIEAFDSNFMNSINSNQN